ncbi:MAG TPA: DUF1003 domain-containing protein [Pyrinomonadaceae bacterium]|jgi:uncharacterized membrane protein
MNNHLQKFVEKRFPNGVGSLPEREQKVVSHYLERSHVSHNVNHEFENRLTFGQRLADLVASFGGSWTFIIIFGSVLIFWVLLNSLILARSGEAFDPYPYILLNLFLSMLAAIQAPIIMMSQNRQTAKDRTDAAHDYEVNLKAELEILSLHEKLDELRDEKWLELVQMQREQIRLLTEIVNQGGANQNNA